MIMSFKYGLRFLQVFLFTTAIDIFWDRGKFGFCPSGPSWIFTIS